MQSSFGAVGQQIVAAQILAVHQSTVDMVAATDRTAAAIVAGFSASEIAAAHATDLAARQHVDVLAAQGSLREIMVDIAAAMNGMAHIHSEEVVTGDMFLPSVQAQTAVLVAGFETLQAELVGLKEQVTALTKETRRTGEALAVK
jgi:hypothetical protein